jgi:hypothetical protein
MSEDFLDDRMEDWERRALKGDYTAMPATFRWSGSARFAHFLNGYDELGGLDRLSAFHRPIAEAQRRSGTWEGSAKDLWLCLFYEHRLARHCGSDAEGPELRRLDSLCETLRVALQTLDRDEAQVLASRTRPE